MDKRSKRGSYIMEAAIVLPIIMVAVITAVLIIMFFYSSMAEQCRMHLLVRSEAGMLTQKTVYVGDSFISDNDAQFHSENKLVGGIVYGKKYIIMDKMGLLRKKGAAMIEGSCHLVDGPRYIRYREVVKDLGDE